MPGSVNLLSITFMRFLNDLLFTSVTGDPEKEFKILFIVAHVTHD